MNKFIDRVIDSSVAYGMIEEKDKDIYTIAITSLFFSFFTWGTLILMGIVFHEVYGSILFLLFHIPLRVYAGGFHQKTRGKCYIQSLVVFVLLIAGAVLGVQDWTAQYWGGLLFVSFMIIWFLAPVEAMNKPLNSEERRHHRTTARTILLIEAAAVILFQFNHFNISLYYSFMSIELVTFQLITGAIEHRLVHDKEMLRTS